MQKSSKEHVLGCLTKLSVSTDKSWKSDALAKLTMATYTDKLVNFSPSAVTAACEEWGDTHDRWPALASLLRLCREQQAHEDSQAKLAAPVDMMPIMCNEVIVALGELDHRLRAAMPHDEYETVLTEAARVWEMIRPQDMHDPLGKPKVVGSVHYRAIEAWVRERAGFEPLHYAYVNDRCAMKFYEMTGRQIRVGADDVPGAQVSPMMEDALRRLQAGLAQ